MNIKSTLAAVSVCMLAAGSAGAAVIDFTTATNDGTTTVAAGATAVAALGSELAIGDFAANAICALGGSGCDGVFTLTFDSDVSSMSFDYGFGNEGDIATLSIFDRLMALVGTVILNSEADVANYVLSGIGNFRSILFDNSAAAGAGYAYGNIEYDSAAVVPLPATLPLLLAGMAGLGLLRRKRQA
jgi:hypothetical protein